MGKAVTRDVRHNGFTYALTLGYEPASTPDESKGRVSGFWYLEGAYCIENASDVQEGDLFDTLERMVYRMDKEGKLDSEFEPDERIKGK